MIGGNLGRLELDGLVWQALPLTEFAPHARRFSGSYLSIACIGDFRVSYDAPPSARQLSSLITLTSLLCIELDLTTGAVVGHGEVDGSHDGSKAPGRPAACPGGLLDMDRLRSAVADEMALVGREAARSRLVGAGLVCP